MCRWRTLPNCGPYPKDLPPWVDRCFPDNCVQSIFTPNTPPNSTGCTGRIYCAIDQFQTVQFATSPFPSLATLPYTHTIRCSGCQTQWGNNLLPKLSIKLYILPVHTVKKYRQTPKSYLNWERKCRLLSEVGSENRHWKKKLTISQRQAVKPVLTDTSVSRSTLLKELWRN